MRALAPEVLSMITGQQLGMLVPQRLKPLTFSIFQTQGRRPCSTLVAINTQILTPPFTFGAGGAPSFVFNKSFNSVMNSCTSLKSRYTEAKRT